MTARAPRKLRVASRGACNFNGPDMSDVDALIMTVNAGVTDDSTLGEKLDALNALSELRRTILIERMDARILEER